MGGHLLLRTLIERRPALDAAVLIAPMIEVNSAPIPSRLAPDIADLVYRLGLGGLPIWKPSRRLQRRRAGGATATSPPRANAMRTNCGGGRQEPAFDLGLPNWGWIRAAFRSGAAAFTPEKLSAGRRCRSSSSAPSRTGWSAPPRSGASRPSCPSAELEMMDDAAHEILRDADPVRLRALARIDAFLAGHAA